MVNTYLQLFGSKPSTKSLSPLEKGDHPKVDDSEFLNVQDSQMYQSLAGAMQWVISIGCFDISMVVTTLSSFQAQPHHGHLECVKHIYGYMYKLKDAKICVCTQEPDYSDILEEEYDWAKSVYGDISKLIPKDAPESLGKCCDSLSFCQCQPISAMTCLQVIPSQVFSTSLTRCPSIGIPRSRQL